jgi:hypothetical protein
MALDLEQVGAWARLAYEAAAADAQGKPLPSLLPFLYGVPALIAEVERLNRGGKPVYRVELAEHCEDHSTGEVWGATRTITLPFPPYAGLEIRWGETGSFLVDDVAYFPDEDVFTADAKGHVANEYESLPDWVQSRRDSGFKVGEASVVPPVGRARHLTVVKPEGGDKK